jgi:hypothetical protein
MSFDNIKTKRNKRILIITSSILLVIAAVTVACVIYLSDYYHADEERIAAFAPMNEVSVTELDNGSIVFDVKDAKNGFIFYPGGKVENDAYKPLMASLASRGILCIIVDMPFNLAVFDVNAADGITEDYPNVENWYIGGHSLGGAMAASYVSEHTDSFDGLVLLDAYSTADLSATDLDVLSVYGSEDKIMNSEKYEEYRSNLPKSFTETVIEGGCHAYFGMYGAQDGDGVPSITCEEQISLTCEAIVKLTEKRK